jgi:hypothetical protein
MKNPLFAVLALTAVILISACSTDKNKREKFSKVINEAAGEKFIENFYDKMTESNIKAGGDPTMFIPFYSYDLERDSNFIGDLPVRVKGAIDKFMGAPPESIEYPNHSEGGFYTWMSDHIEITLSVEPPKEYISSSWKILIRYYESIPKKKQ